MSLEEKLYELRKDRKLTQDDLAEALDVTRQTISNWENGVAVPSIGKAKELAYVYGISLDELVGNKRIENPNESLVKKWEGKRCKVIMKDDFVTHESINFEARILEVDAGWITLEYYVKGGINKKKEQIERQIIEINTVMGFIEVEDQS